MFLNAILLPATAAALAMVAEGAVLERGTATFLNGRNLKLFCLFCPTIMMEFLLKFSVIFAILLSFAELMMFTFGNHLLRILTLFSTGSGFFVLPTECDTTMMGVLFDLRAVSITCSIMSL